MEAKRQVTQLLAQMRSGDRNALDGALPLIYEELERLARRQLRREAVGHTLNTGALVHEAYLRLVDHSCVDWRDRGHFLATAATAMRRVLIDHARRRHAQRRGAAARRTFTTLELLGGTDRSELLIDLDEALSRLAQLDARQAKVVELRFFGGLTEEEISAALDISVRTVKRDWAKARSWLYQELCAEVTQ
jgi:RNA polymerase sigma factor (TIGR02999 family)